MDTTLIAQRIRFYRQLANLTQEQLAEKANVSVIYIRKLEAGSRTPSLDVIMILASVLQTTPNHLLLPTSQLDMETNSSIFSLLDDCTSKEFSILYENMVHLKNLLRIHTME